MPDWNAHLCHPVFLTDVELSRPLPTLTGLGRYHAVRVLVRLHQQPVGVVMYPLKGCDHLSAMTLAEEISTRLTDAIVTRLADGVLRQPISERAEAPDIRRLLQESPTDVSPELPSITVAVCTRDRVCDLAACLEAIERLEYPGTMDVLVVDNAPSTDQTRELLASRFASVRYVREPRPGLDWARNRALLETRGDIIAFTDDDVLVDPDWLTKLGLAFATQPHVDAVTGLVVPHELETPAQALFEHYGGFARGYQRQWHHGHRSPHRPDMWYIGAGMFGTGANMAFRRSLFDRIGGFEPGLDVGTPTNGGGDLEIYYRLLRHGAHLLYEPAAIVRHRHRRDDAGLLRQIHGWGSGVFAYLLHVWRRDPKARGAIVRLTRWWLFKYIRQSLFKSLLWKRHRPICPLVLAEVRGALAARRCVAKTGEQIGRTVAEHGPMPITAAPAPPAPGPDEPAVAVRTVNLATTLDAISDVGHFAATQVMVMCNDRLLGKVVIDNGYAPIPTDHLRQALAKEFGRGILTGNPGSKEGKNFLEARVLGALTIPAAPPSQSQHDSTVSASIVVATFDRPDDLRQCLRSLTSQQTSRRVEIIVVDNHPASGQTPPVVREFAGVRLISEPRPGLSYARNAGFAASTGDLVVATDDDVVMPTNWLDALLTPMDDPQVMVVTGNVLPLELDTRAQQMFEAYGGLGRGLSAKRVDAHWFNSFRRSAVPTWSLGATANAAFRASIFSHPDIGLLDEALGAGSPTGCSEDTDLFYRVLKAGYDIVYEPQAYVWHRHRRDMRSLRKQIFAYSKGHVAAQWLTLLRHGDRRSLYRLLVEIPPWEIKQLIRSMLGRSQYPVSLRLVEIGGLMAGPWALWRSLRRVRRLGRSDPYLPPSMRANPCLATVAGHADPGDHERALQTQSSAA